MRFGSPLCFYLLLLIPVLIVFFRISRKQRERALRLFGDPALMARITDSVSHPMRRLKGLLILSAIGFLVLAMARPQIGTKAEIVKRLGNDVVFVIDTSLSMLAEDIKPNRLEKAKYEISRVLDRMRGDRVGLVAFAGTAFLQCPLTLDYGAARMFLDIIDTEIIPKPGTAIETAIRTAADAFEKGERKHKIMILLTDGEDHRGDPVGAAEELAKQGVIIYPVGIGSQEGAPIPVKDEDGRLSGHKKDRSGKPILSKLDETTLRKIALNTDGKYYRATATEFELGKLYDQIEEMEKKELESKLFTQFEDRFQWILVPAILLLAIEVILSDRSRKKRAWTGRFS